MRAYSLLEVSVVIAISGVVAGLAVTGVSAAVAQQRDRESLGGLLSDVQRERNAHVSTGRGGFLVVCVDCVDEGGNPAEGGDNGGNNNGDDDGGERGGGTLDFYVVDDPRDFETGRVVFSQHYDRVALSIPGKRVVIDSIGRSVAVTVNAAGAANLRPVDGRLDIQLAKRNAIVFDVDGRLVPTFGPPISPVPPHARNLSSRTTIDPMPLGRFEGDPDRAAAMPLH